MTDEALARQPERITIAPSQSYPWYGTAALGERFTEQQLRAAATMDLDLGAAEILTVRREATTREMWWPSRTPSPVFQFDCPVLDRRRDGKVRVIAPAGYGALVHADGWVNRPGRENWQKFKDAARGARISPDALASGSTPQRRSPLLQPQPRAVRATQARGDDAGRN